MAADSLAMRIISDTEAQTHFDRLLDDVEGGETFLITRNGRVVARIEPEPPVAASADVRVDPSAMAL
jgi:antitoxin (DNA-binding transcriptional repressor) of toxin-antitoxin stability system